MLNDVTKDNTHSDNIKSEGESKELLKEKWGIYEVTATKTVCFGTDIYVKARSEEEAEELSFEHGHWEERLNDAMNDCWADMPDELHTGLYVEPEDVKEGTVTPDIDGKQIFEEAEAERIKRAAVERERLNFERFYNAATTL
jgi:hypothetical protein